MSAADGLLREVRRGERRTLTTSTALFVSHQVGEGLVPVVAGLVIDRAVVTADAGALVRWMLVLAVVFAVLSTSWRWGDRIFTAGYERAGHQLRLRIGSRVTAPEGLADRAASGQVVSVASSDVDATTSILEAVASAIAALGGLLVAAVVLLVISPTLGLLVLIGLPPVLGLLQILTGPIEARFSAQQDVVAKAAATATDLLRGLRVVKGLHLEGEAAARYRRASRSSLVAGLRASRLYAAQGGLTAAVTGIFVALIALVGGRLAADGRISIGELVAAVGVTQFLVGPIGRVGWAVAQRATARASAARVAAVLDGPVAVTDGGPDDGATGGGTAGGALALHDLHHGALAGFDLVVPAGRLVGIAAPEPEARALVELLGRTVDPDRGEVTVDGVALPAWSLSRLRRTVLVAEHEAPLFTGTVAENVAGASDGGIDLDAAALADLLVAVAVDEVADALPQGLATPVTERGLSLSGGQRQRVALARALAADPAVLVLHDPTTAIDSVTEARIAEGLRRTRDGRTTVVLTTSPSLLAAADHVVFVADGRVAATGTHAELVAADRAYARAVLT